MKQPYFLHADTNSHQLEVDQKNFCWTWPKMGVASVVVTGL